ncbi:uncharacterized protein LOC105797467 [Gossypium raimondii]|uniref:uncharacterized protein LOC105797467 n=1 Tax=Gossypium raimondii TaxID=29730 RepID=UPI00063AB121|nr:uncharacterized protein LOC105797467 [Gossypium raimondii]
MKHRRSWKKIANNNYLYPTNRVGTGKRVVSTIKLDAITLLTIDVSSLANMIKTMKNPTVVHEVKSTEFSCIYCGENNVFDECSSNPTSVYYIDNSNRNSNPYSNTYNLGWKHHLNFSWGNQGTGNFNSAARQNVNNATPGYNHPMPRQNAQQGQVSFSNSIEDLLKEYMAKNDSVIQSQATSLRALENQVGKIENALNLRPQGALSKEDNASNNQVRIPEPSEKHTTSENDKKKNAVRFHKSKQDAQFKIFLEVSKQLHINILLVKALDQMPNYVKFMKDILSKKCQLGKFETVALTEGCTAMLMNKLPSKLKDRGSFTIPCSIRNHYVGKSLCDLSASINLMPMSIFRKLGIEKGRPITVTLQLADRS